MDDKKEEKKGNKAMLFILLIIYISLSVGGLVLFKMGSINSPIHLSLQKRTFEFGIALESILGLICYVSSFLLYMYLISIYNLNYIAPIAAGATYILTIAASYFVFHEPFTMFQVVGIFMIFGGVVLMNFKK